MKECFQFNTLIVVLLVIQFSVLVKSVNVLAKPILTNQKEEDDGESSERWAVYNRI